MSGGFQSGLWENQETGGSITPGRIRTCDLRFRKPLLYPLSYGRESLIF
jgi:hypothetical protein